MLNGKDARLLELAKRENYQVAEFLSASKVRLYIAEEGLVLVDGKRRKVRCQTLTPATITQESGIEARSFDSTIEAMNRIQGEILWGEEAK